MNTKSSSKLKKKSLKNKRTKKIIECQCIRNFLSNRQKHENQNYTTIKKAENTSPKTEKTVETLAVVTPPKKLQKSRIIRLPKIGCTIPFLMSLFNGLCNSGAVCLDEGQMGQAVNIIAKAKQDIDEGMQWNGNIQICENIKLKLYKSGLVLFHKM